MAFSNPGRVAISVALLLLAGGAPFALSGAPAAASGVVVDLSLLAPGAVALQGASGDGGCEFPAASFVLPAGAAPVSLEDAPGCRLVVVPARAISQAFVCAEPDLAGQRVVDECFGAAAGDRGDPSCGPCVVTDALTDAAECAEGGVACADGTSPENHLQTRTAGSYVDPCAVRKVIGFLSANGKTDVTATMTYWLPPYSPVWVDWDSICRETTFIRSTTAACDTHGWKWHNMQGQCYIQYSTTGVQSAKYYAEQSSFGAFNHHHWWGTDAYHTLSVRLVGWSDGTAQCFYSHPNGGAHSSSFAYACALF